MEQSDDRRAENQSQDSKKDADSQRLQNEQFEDESLLTSQSPDGADFRGPFHHRNDQGVHNDNGRNREDND